MILASGEINLFVLVVMAVIGLINWLASKRNEEKPPAPPPAGKVGPRSGPADAEDERMRRFLEALGIPADSAPPRPVPPIVTPKAAPRRPKVRKPAPPPLPRAAREMSLDEQPAPSRPAGEIELPELAVPIVSEFETVASHVAAIPSERLPTERPSGTVSALGDVIRRELASPTQLRGALVLREILGPPRGLQGWG